MSIRNIIAVIGLASAMSFAPDGCCSASDEGDVVSYPLHRVKAQELPRMNENGDVVSYPLRRVKTQELPEMDKNGNVVRPLKFEMQH